jgi:hypothetical protein
MRRTYRTIHGAIGTPANIGERLVNHVAAVTTEVERIYDRHTYLAEMRTAVERWEGRFSAIITENQVVAKAAYPRAPCDGDDRDARCIRSDRLRPSSAVAS